MREIERRLRNLEQSQAAQSPKRLLCLEWWPDETHEDVDAAIRAAGIEPRDGDMIVGLVPLDDTPTPARKHWVMPMRGAA